MRHLVTLSEPTSTPRFKEVQLNGTRHNTRNTRIIGNSPTLNLFLHKLYKGTHKVQWAYIVFFFALPEASIFRLQKGLTVDTSNCQRAIWTNQNLTSNDYQLTSSNVDLLDLNQGNTHMDYGCYAQSPNDVSYSGACQRIVCG